MPPTDPIVMDHAPTCGRWDCAGCDDPAGPTLWPCIHARLHLLRVYAGARTCLRVYLEGCLVRACHDLSAAAAGDLYGRFVGWLDQLTQPTWYPNRGQWATP